MIITPEIFGAIQITFWGLCLSTLITYGIIKSFFFSIGKLF